MAYQLGGPDAYAIVADADRAGTPPGQALHQLLHAYAPAVILIDEWVAYARSLFTGDDLAGGTFEGQFTFAQSLTEAVKNTPGVMLAVSIPASDPGGPEVVAGSAEEVGGQHGMEALRRLQMVVGRVADQWRPASATEAYHIVRQRLFQPIDDARTVANIKATARAFVEMYRKHNGDFPREARDVDYEERIRQTYPIHPELFDRLYEDWSTLDRFQRTRGVLRLMNTVINTLWNNGDAAPLIMPGSIPLAAGPVNTELTGYLQDSWKAIIDADVDGPNSEPVKIDTEKRLYGQRHMTKRLARTVFFGTAPTVGSASKGLERQRVFLGTALPGDVPGNFHSALTALSDRATYFYSGSGKYWYDVHANINRRARDQAERLHQEDVWAEIARRLHGQSRHPGDFAGVHVCPETTGDVPDTDEARLVILHPRETHQRRSVNSAAMTLAQETTSGRGTANRVYRNMLVYLAADADRMEELERAVRDYLGWAHVLDPAAELDLTDNQKEQARHRLAQADDTVSSRLMNAYHWVLVPTAPHPDAPFVIKVTKSDGQSGRLAEQVSKRLKNDGELNVVRAGANIRLDINVVPAVWQSGHVAVGDLWALYASYPYMPRLRDQAVLSDGLTAQLSTFWEHDGFALAQSYDGDAQRYVGLVLPTDPVTPQVTDTMLVVRPDVAVAQRAVEEREQPPATASVDVIDTPVGGDAPAVAVPAQRDKRHATRFFGSKELRAERYAMDFKKVADEVLAHLAAAHGVNLSVRIEIEATSPDGFDEAKVRTVSENATTLKFDQSGFEDE